jgi:NAD(P)-dependent dehydrogenase (short-subunit alcohol dehydrogenase family)
MVHSAPLDLTARDTIAAAIRAAVLRFGGFDTVVNTAAVFPTPGPSTPPEDTWATALSINVTANYVLAEEAARILRAQKLPASIVLTSSANAVVPKSGSEAYDVSKAAINHLVRELAIGLGPLVRVNAIAPATVIVGSSMFPRDRVIVSLKKYGIAFDEAEPTDDLLAHGQSKRKDDRPRDPRRRRPAGSVPALNEGRLLPPASYLPSSS